MGAAIMLQNVSALIEGASKFVITTHTRPDGDAIGSALAFEHYLRQKGKDGVIINCDPTPFNLEWLPGAGRVQVFENSISQLEAIAEADVIAVLDANGQGRLGAMGKLVRGSTATKLLVDHHTDPEGWFDLAYVREEASSTGELIYDLITRDDPALIDANIAAGLYAAIVTDTGSFRYSNVTPALHRAVADIIERGDLDSSAIHSAIYDRKSPGGVQLLSRVLNSMQFSHGEQVAYTVISRAMLDETGASIEETEGFVNWGLAVEGVRVGILFTETERGTKASFRSRGEDHVHKWAQAFGGGGHPNAAGAFVRKPLDKAINSVLERAGRFLDLGASEETGDGLSDEDREYLTMLRAMPPGNRKPA